MSYVTLYNETYLRLVCYVNKFLNNWHEAEDIAQDVFSKYYTLKPDIKINEEINYLYKMARNLLITHVRRREYLERYKATIDPDEAIDTVTNYDENFLKARVREAIHRMKPSKYKTILIHHFVYGMTYEEIADTLNMDRNVLRKNKAFGLNKLKEIFAN